MIYYFLRFIFRITVKVYFKTIDINGIENIPEKGPLFIVANHPSGFMDPIVIAALTKRRLFFIAKGAAFNHPVARWLLPRFNIIPIYRSHETPGLTHKNKDVFHQCHQHLAKGGAILIFPEGISLTERKIKKIQSGTARICFGAEAANNFKLNIKIVTVGLNFSNPHKFQSDLFVNIDQPIHVADYYELYQQDAFKAAHALTDEIRRRIESRVIAIDDKETDILVSKIELMQKSRILKDLGFANHELDGDFIATKIISDTVHYYQEHQPERVERVKNDIDSYLFDLDQLRLNDTLLKSLQRTTPILDALFSMLYMAVGFPLYVFGVINNYIPFKIPNWSFHYFSRRPEFFGSIAITIGTLAFIVFYSIQIWIVTGLSHDWRIITGYIILLPLSGFFAFYYFRKLKTLRGRWLLFSLFYRKTSTIASILLKRESIIHKLEEARKEYLETMQGKENSQL